MSFSVILRLVDQAGTTFVQPRREDGHGSSAATPTYVAASQSGQWYVKDRYSTIETTTDQNGANDVLTFTVSGAGDFLMVDVDNTSPTDYTTYRARATVDGSTPTSTNGIVCRSGQTTYIPFPTTGTSMKVYAPVGTVVSVQLGHY